MKPSVSRCTATAAAASASDAGSAKRSTLLVKSFPAAGGGTVSEMKTAGIPRVSRAVRPPWRGEEGEIQAEHIAGHDDHVGVEALGDVELAQLRAATQDALRDRRPPARARGTSRCAGRSRRRPAQSRRRTPSRPRRPPRAAPARRSRRPPTIATKCPPSRSAATMRAFSWGAMRPKMLCSSTARAKPSASSASSAGPAIAPPGSRMRSWRSNATTVSGLSPLITFGSMPSSAIVGERLRDLGAEAVGERQERDRVAARPGARRDRAGPGLRRRSQPAVPARWRPGDPTPAPRRCRRRGGRSRALRARTSAAPRPGPGRAALQRRAEVKGTRSSARAPFDDASIATASACAVRFSRAIAAAKPPSHAWSAAPAWAQCAWRNVRALAVMVPVLSRQITST